MAVVVKNIRRGFQRLYVVFAALMLLLACWNVFAERRGDDRVFHASYDTCVRWRLNTNRTTRPDNERGPIFSFPSLPKKRILVDGEGKPVYDAEAYPDFREWQELARRYTKREDAREAIRPAVEKYCVADASRERNWFEVKELCFVVAVLAAFYWFWILTAVVGRWVYRGFNPI